MLPWDAPSFRPTPHLDYEQMFADGDNLSEPAPPADLSPDQLESELVSLAAQINAATCRWLALAAEFDRRGAHEAFGFNSCATWLAWRCSLTARAAREQLRVARSMEDLPKIHAEFAAGRLSYSKVRALSRVAEPAMEDELIELAHCSTASQLERLMRAYRTATAEDDEIAADRRHLTTWWEDDGTLTINGNLPAEEGALLLKALDLARAELFASYTADAAAFDESADWRGEAPAKPNAADAFVAIAETTIAQGAQAASGGDRHQVIVHVDATAKTPEVKAAAPKGGSAEPPEPPPGQGVIGIARASISDVPLSPEVARRLACDASIVTLVEADGVPLSVGRKTRSIPPAIRRALNSRDGCCAYPGCEQSKFVDAHHMLHWADGGETSMDNLLLLCRRHHRLVHEGGVTIEGPAKSPRFRRRDGELIAEAPPLPSVPPSAASLGLFAQDSPPPWGKGEPMDLDLAVFALAKLQERRAAREPEGEPEGKNPYRPPPESPY